MLLFLNHNHGSERGTITANAARRPQHSFLAATADGTTMIHTLAERRYYVISSFDPWHAGTYGMLNECRPSAAGHDSDDSNGDADVEHEHVWYIYPAPAALLPMIIPDLDNIGATTRPHNVIRVDQDPTHPLPPSLHLHGRLLHIWCIGILQSSQR
jgi:hypothetical protein